MVLIGPVAAAAIPAGISAVASIFGGERANRANRVEAARNRRFQERMRNTEWQAAVEDMRKAGINPAVAYSQGGASSPGGSMAQVSDTISPAVSSAREAAFMAKQMRLLDAQISATTEQARKTFAEGQSAQIEKLFREGRYRHLFTANGEPKGALKEFWNAELAQGVGNARLTKFNAEQQRIMAEFFTKTGASGQMAQRFLLPLLLGAMR